jgi:folylpolyglutamate synthase
LDEKDLAQLKTQTDLATAWKGLIPSFSEDHIHIVPSIQHAVNIVEVMRKSRDKPVDALVTGSLLLVGGLIEVARLSTTALEV